MHTRKYAFYKSKTSVLLNVTRETFYRKRDHSPLILAHHLHRLTKIYCVLLVEIRLFACVHPITIHVRYS